MSDPLAGRRVLLTRSAEDNREWAERLRARGVDPVLLTCLETAPLPAAAAELERGLADCDWLVLSSRRAALAVRELRGERALPDGLRVACVGPATAAAAAEALGRADEVAPLGTGRSLGAALAATLPRSARVLIAAAEEGRVDVEEVLRPVGVDVRRVAVYRTIPVGTASGPLGAHRPGDAEPGAAGTPLYDLALDAAFLASPSAVRGLVAQVRLPAHVRVVAIGPTTAAAARAAGLAVHAEARARGLDGMCAALSELLESEPTPNPDPGR